MTLWKEKHDDSLVSEAEKEYVHAARKQKHKVNTVIMAFTYCTAWARPPHAF